MQRSKMNICITGAGGYIGNHLLNLLVGDPDICLYAVFRSTPKRVDKRIKVVEADLSKENWTGLLPDRIDTVIHLAQSRRYKDFPEGSSDVFDVNMKATFKLLEWSRLNGVKRFIFASTGSVYKQKKGLLLESDTCIPDSMYSASKLCGEHLVRQYCEFFETIITRLFFVYGPDQKNRLIPNIIDKVALGKQIFLGQGEGMHFTPLYVEDCVQIFKRLASVTLPAREWTINIAGNEVLSLKDVAVLAGLLKGRKPNIVITDEKLKWFCADTSRLNTIYKTVTGIKDGLHICAQGV